MSTPSLGRLALLVGINRYANRLASDELRGAVNDVYRMADILEYRFGFRESELRMLLDAQATRKQILDAFDDLVSDVSAGCCVVIHWSGHGSQIPARTMDGAAFEGHGYDETLVPHDARGEQIRDLTDKDFLRILSRLEDRGATVTWIADSCHSGHLYRDSRLGKARHLPAAGSTSQYPLPCRATLGDAFAPRARQRCRRVLLAACHHTETALERPFAAREDHGEWTYALAAALGNCSPEATVRQVFDEARLRMLREGVRQNPRAVGDRDRLIFGVRARPPVRYLEIRTSNDGEAWQLQGGNVHGLCEGGQWSIFPAQTYDPEEGTLLAQAEVEEVGAATSRVVIVREPNRVPRSVQSGDWAFEHRPAYGELRLGVAIAADAPSQLESGLAESIERSPLLFQASIEDDVDVLVRLERGGFRMLDRWGFPLSIDLEDSESPPSLLIPRRLERRARASHARRLRNKNSDSRVSTSLKAQLLKQVSSEAWQPAPIEDEASGMPQYVSGELVALEATHTFDRELYIYILDFGLTDRVTQVFPPPGGEERLKPSEALRAGTLPHDELELFLPGPEEGRGGLKVIATTHPTCLDWLRTDVSWPDGVYRSAASSLESLLSMGSSAPSFRTDEDWGCVECPFFLGGAS